MRYDGDLMDLLNTDPAAYEFFYGLPPQTQNLLQRRSIRSMEELRQAAADVGLDSRPKAF